MINRPRRAARRRLLPLPAPLPPLPLLLLLLSAAAPPRLTLAAKPRAPPAFVFGRPLAPHAPDAHFESLLALAQVPALHSDASSSSFSSASTSHRDQEQQHPQIDPEPQQQQQPQPAPPPPLRDEDFVFATGTCRERMHLAKSTRAWRRGIRAFILTDQDQLEALARLNAEGAGGGGGDGGAGGDGGPPPNEAYAFFPDDRAAALGGVAHGTKKGDTRAAVAPFAAHRHFGETYKWLLYGDDDTLFFMDAVKRMLAAFDPDLPLAFSDNLWYFGEQPNAHAPRCLPCHMVNDTAALPTLRELAQTPSAREHLRKWLQARSSNVTEADVDELVQEAREVPGRLFVPRPACPYCTPEKACSRDIDPPNKAPCNPSVAHGGAGMIFSVGLLRSLPYTDALACIRSFRAATGGDALVCNCLWRHGIAFTDPGPLVRHAYDPHYHVFGGGKSGQGYLWDPIGMMTHGRCNAKCRWMLRNTLSLHLKGRHFRSWRVGSVLMWGIAHASRAAHSFLELASRDGGVSWKQLPYGFDVDDAAGFAPYMALAAPPTPAGSASTSTSASRSRSRLRSTDQGSAGEDGGEE